jgi:hypothetical protein
MENMNDPLLKCDTIPPWRFALRLVWVVVQLSLVYALGAAGAQFVYQGF